MTMENIKLLSVKDIQTKLGISAQNAYTIFHRSDFPLIKFGGRLYVRQEAFLKWLEGVESAC
ncbi:MAG: helix-turn-helix domain-containing protein [Oscillospiraceae bacterium]|nr:helix-turn-helix domain-containing protein [Oscillospiraceae bacterium]